jgi:hypothetical protein
MVDVWKPNHAETARIRQEIRSGEHHGGLVRRNGQNRCVSVPEPTWEMAEVEVWGAGLRLNQYWKCYFKPAQGFGIKKKVTKRNIQK